MSFDASTIRANAERFDRDRFVREMKVRLDTLLAS
jgi:hypothetical protein